MVAKVLINTNVKSLNRVYDYLVKDEDIFNISIGKRVKVSFGRGKSFTEGVIVKLCDESTSKFKLKYIEEILDEVSYIDSTKLKLAKWMSYMYFCNVYDCLKLMFPPGTNNIKNSKNMDVIKYEKIVCINPSLTDNDIECLRRAKHIEILKFLKDVNDYISEKELISALNISKSVISTLERNDLIKVSRREVKESLIDLSNVSRTYKLNPTDEQLYAINGINDIVSMYNGSKCLLFGVTGSGKTEVYLQVIEKVLNDGKNVIVLVPEISLTSQTLTRFISRFGDVVSMLHSRMTINERKKEYLKICKNEVRIVIGARSAIFAPVSNLGLVIIDEEHDSSYYSSTTPRYSTKEVASYLCKEYGATLLLGSATPEVTTFYRAMNGSISLFTLKNRPGNSTLPEIIMVDRKLDRLNNKDIITNRLKEEILINLMNKEKTILFLNKRGYSSYLTCKDCSYVFKCPNCDVAMTYHKKSNLCLCHFCSHAEKNIVSCPICNSTNLSESSFGTEKIEEEILRLFPSAKILRMDRDTTLLKDSHAKILSKFRDEDIDILIGTQMISKGHDIPSVTLVGVLGTDTMLHMNDFLGTERAYSNISQVAGRCGRGDKPGRVVIETEDVLNETLSYATNHDYESFYNAEIVFRKAFLYPPFCDIILFSMKSKDINILRFDSAKLYDILNCNSNNLFKVFTPKAPFVEKINNEFRINILIKTNVSKDVMVSLYQCIDKYNSIKNNKVSMNVIRNPINFG